MEITESQSQRNPEPISARLRSMLEHLKIDVRPIKVVDRSKVSDTNGVDHGESRRFSKTIETIAPHQGPRSLAGRNFRQIVTIK